jgi:hypothetical protein
MYARRSTPMAKSAMNGSGANVMLDHAFTITWCAPRNPAGSFEAAAPFAATAVPLAALPAVFGLI